MAFGFKIKKLKTSRAYTLEELFEQIQDKTFTAGQPSLTKHGLTTVITFPPLDRNNQIWLMQAQMSKPPYTQWQVYKNQPAGVENMVVNEVLEQLTDGFSRLSGAFGNNAKKIEQLVEITANELEQLNL